MLKTITMTTALALILGAPIAFAQQSQMSDQQQRRDDARQRSTDDRPTNQLTLADANTIQGSTVANVQGESIGKVEDVVVDIKRGQVAYAIVGVGGFLGVGEKNVAVPWDRLRPGQEAQSFVLNVDRQTLQNAPAVDRDKLAQLESQPTRRSIAAFWDKAANQQAQVPHENKSRER